MKEFWEQFLTSNSTSARLARTLVQGIVSILLVSIPAAIGDPDVTSIPGAAVALVMAALSAIMGALSGNSKDASGDEE